jgi:hypothetical protein
MFLHHGQAERVTQGPTARLSQKICRSISENTVSLNGRIKNQKMNLLRRGEAPGLDVSQ